MAGLFSNTTRVAIVVACLGSLFYQGFLKNILWVTAGLGREIQPISDFPYTCRRIVDPRLQACEDMWLSEETRQLFLACSDSLARKQWMPNVGRLNASGRALDDAVIAMDIDKPNGDSYNYRVLQTEGYSGVAGDSRLHLVGFTGRDPQPGKEGAIDLLFVNAKPSVDAAGNIVDNTILGPNMTIEAFTTTDQATVLTHTYTYMTPEITTPNNIAFSASGFFFTNDHGDATVGFRHSIAPYVGIGSVGHCSTDNPLAASQCAIQEAGLRFPNGLMTSSDRRTLYVPSAWSGGIYVYNTITFERVNFIDIPYPIDNLSEDQNGDIWAAALPKALKVLAGFEDPLNSVPPATVFRVRRRLHGWDVKKVLEDKDGEVLPGATTVVHDAKTGRLFLSGVTAPFITVCEPKRG